MKTIRKSIYLPHSIEDVWCALTSPKALAEWLMPNTFSSPTVGAQFRFQYDPEPICVSGIVQCEIIEVSPFSSMTWKWQNGPHKVGAEEPPAMQVKWELSREGQGTRLQMIQTGLKGQPWFIPFAMSFGWSAYLKKLLPKALVNVSNGAFTPGAIPVEKRFYKATNLPPEVTK